MRNRAVTATVLSLLLITQAATADRPSLPGFQKFRFGMSEQDIRRITKIDEATPEDGGVRLRAAQSTEIDGLSYRLSFLLNGGKLRRVRLVHDTDDSGIGCEGHFNRVFGLVKAKYGDPD